MRNISLKTLLLGAMLLVMPVAMMLATPATANAQIGVGISVRVAPPVIPVYAQPVCPGDGYIWTPGYWAYGDDDYYWVPGTWILAPEPGFLWTPGYWGWGDGAYLWHGGYWGPHVGFYGGINYGFGYFGAGFVGGEWRGRTFAYNRAVTNVNVTVIHNVYNNTTVVRNVNVNNHTSFNGPGGIQARPSAADERFAHENHVQPTSAQMDHQKAAGSNRALFASTNHGKPPIAATTKPGEFSGKGVVAAKSAPTYRPTTGNPAVKGGAGNANANRPAGNANRPAGNTGNANAEKPAGNTRADRPSTATPSHGAATGGNATPANRPATTTRADRPPTATGNKPATTTPPSNNRPATTTRTDRPPSATTTHNSNAGATHTTTPTPARTPTSKVAPTPRPSETPRTSAPPRTPAPPRQSTPAPRAQPQHQAPAPKAQPQHENAPHSEAKPEHH